MLTTPSIRQFTDNSSIDGKQDNVFYFDSIGGDLVAKNRLVIQNIINNETVYDQEQITYSLQHTVPMNTLTNGSTYKAKIMTYNQQNETSDWSNWFIFTAYSIPLVTFLNLGVGNITSQNYMFTANYLQEEGLKMKYFRFLLYDDNRDLISESELLYDEEIKYEISNFKNDDNYYIEFRATSTSNATATTGLKRIYVSYLESEGGNILEVVNNSEDATIDLKVKVRDSRFAIREGIIEYVDDEWINLDKGIIYTDEILGFSLNDIEWSMTLKIMLYANNYDILKLVSEDSYYLLISRDNEKLYIRQYNGEDLSYNSWVYIPNVALGDIITLHIARSGFYINKKVIIDYSDKFTITDSNGNDILTSNEREMLLSRKGVI